MSAALAYVAPDDARQTGARNASRIHFGMLGVTGGVWGVHVPSLKAQYGLDEGTLSLVLLAGGVGAVASLFAAGRLVGRFGARRVVVGASWLLGGMFALVLQWPGLLPVFATMLLFGAAMSTYDVSINTEGSALEALSGRTIMGNLHGMFSVGAMAGAAAAAALLRLDVGAGVQLAGTGALLAGVATLAGRRMLDAHPPTASAEAGDEQAHFAWPHGTLLVLGLLVFAGMLAEGVMYDWCVLYLKQELGLTQDVAGLGYAAFAGAMAAARFGSDALRARYPESWLLVGGAGLTAVAMAAVLLSGHPAVALVGYALMGAGLAPVVPILFNAATRVPGTSRAAAIASVSSVGYSGFLIGPPLIGGLAHAASLTAAMGVVVVAATVLALGAGRVPMAPAAPSSPA